MMEVVSRSIAKNSGSRHYFTGKPCVHGHVAARFVSNKTCIECLADQSDSFYRRHRDRLAIDAPRKRAAYFKRHPEQRIIAAERSRFWYAKNKEWAKARIAAWQRMNAELVQMYGSKRRAAKLTTSDGSVTAKAIAELLLSQLGLCVYCCRDIVDGYDIDHKVALSCGGLHVISNIQLLCQPCNGWKGTKSDSACRQIRMIPC